DATTRTAWRRVAIALAAMSGLAFALLAGVITVNPVALAGWSTIFIVLAGAAYVMWLLRFGGLTQAERHRLLAFFVLCMAAAMFWAGFEQAGSSLNLFAERYTDRVLGTFTIPAGWFQTLNPVFIIVLAPVFASLWTRLALRGL